MLNVINPLSLFHLKGPVLPNCARPATGFGVFGSICARSDLPFQPRAETRKAPVKDTTVHLSH